MSNKRLEGLTRYYGVNRNAKNSNPILTGLNCLCCQKDLGFVLAEDQIAVVKAWIIYADIELVCSECRQKEEITSRYRKCIICGKHNIQNKADLISHPETCCFKLAVVCADPDDCIDKPNEQEGDEDAEIESDKELAEED